MWPWGHAAVGYLLYSLGRRAYSGRSPGAVPALSVVVGTLVADLVDKPLAWSVGVLPTGRSLAHSLVFVLPVIGVLWWRYGDRYRSTVAAFATGWLSHLVADGVGITDPAYFGYLLWPVTTTPPYETDQSFVAHFTTVTVTPLFLAQILLVVAAFALWRRDGYPGATYLVPARIRPERV